jgi:hypothetical protein
MINYDDLNEKMAQKYFEYFFYEDLEKDLFSKNEMLIKETEDTNKQKGCYLDGPPFLKTR